MDLTYGEAGNFTVTMEGPYGSSGSMVLLRQLSLPAANWKGGTSPYSQSVELEELSINSKVDLLPDHQQLEQFRSRELAFTTQNDSGSLTVYAIGDRPDCDLSFQISITEVSV